MLVSRAHDAIVLPQLRSAECGEPCADSDRLFGQEGVMSGAVDALVELEIERVVSIIISRLDHRVRSIVQLKQMAALERRHAIGCETYAHRLDLSRRLEHVHDPLSGHPGDDGSAARAHLDQATHRELT